MQLLMLDDLGVELEVYHGKITKTIDNLLNERKIKHHVFSSDVQSKNRFESAKNFLKFKKELKKLAYSKPKNNIFWFGNAETVAAFPFSILKNIRFVVSVLELYDENSFLDKKLSRILKYAEHIICCEKHRSAIMSCRYRLNNMPYVIPNKPYEGIDTEVNNTELSKALERYQNKIIVVYQGIITPDRPLDKIAKALHQLHNDNIYFFILGKYKNSYRKEIENIYKNAVFWGFVPAPEHLIITKSCSIGVANYDMSCLNNVFCAPNKIYEYTRYSLPLITSRNIGLTETVGLAGAAECVDFNDIDDITNGINKILCNYKTYSENAHLFYSATDNKIVISEIVRKLAKEEISNNIKNSI